MLQVLATLDRTIEPGGRASGRRGAPSQRISPWGNRITQSSRFAADGAIESLFRCRWYEMAAVTLLPLAPESEVELRDWATVFTFRATKGELVILELFGLQDPTTAQVRVLAHVRNVRATVERPPERSLYSFPDREHATRFANEAILCFEYLGCVITSELA